MPRISPKITSLALFIVFLFTVSAPAQKLPPKPAKTALQNKFISTYGNFGIDLPENPMMNKGLRFEDEKGAVVGAFFAWDFENVFYSISYSDSTDIQKAATPAQIKLKLNEINQDTRKSILSNQANITVEKPIILNNQPGLEIQALQGTGKNIVRNYLVNKRHYFVQAAVRDLKDEAKALKILNSFKLIDGRAVIQKKILAATPKPLPQLPAVKFPKTDLATANLKGKVKTVIEESEDLTGDSVQPGRIYLAEFFYNPQGFQTKEIRYDYRGNPFQIAVFGYIDKALVCKFGSIKYNYNPPAPVSTTEKSGDSRYDLKIEYIFDETGRVKESSYFRSDGELRAKTVVRYEGNKTETLNYNKTGEIVSKSTEIFDDKGLLVESVLQLLMPNIVEQKVVYKYESFDTKGNWTKRILSEWITEEGKSAYQPTKIYYRNFTYYN